MTLAVCHELGILPSGLSMVHVALSPSITAPALVLTALPPDDDRRRTTRTLPLGSVPTLDSALDLISSSSLDNVCIKNNKRLGREGGQRCRLYMEAFVLLNIRKKGGSGAVGVHSHEQDCYNMNKINNVDTFKSMWTIRLDVELQKRFKDLRIQQMTLFGAHVGDYFPSKDNQK